MKDTDIRNALAIKKLELGASHRGSPIMNPSRIGGGCLVHIDPNTEDMWCGPNAYTKQRGYGNFCFGFHAGQYMGTESEYNVYIGYEAGRGYSPSIVGSGDDNTAVGAQALKFIKTGYYNTAIGAGALFANETGFNDTAVGFEALSGVTTGNNNTGVGVYAGDGNFNGSACCFFGYLSSSSDAAAVNSIAIGANSTITKSNQTVIGNANTTEATIYGALSIISGGGTATAGDISGTGVANRIAEWAGTKSLQASKLIGPTSGTLTLSAAGAYTVTFPNSMSFPADAVGYLYNNGSALTWGTVTGGSVTGTGVAGQVAVWTGTNTIAGTALIEVTSGKVGINLGGATPVAILDINGAINGTEFKINNAKVLGERVIDERIDDGIGTAAWTSTEAGVLDAIRDALIIHGLISSS